MLGLALEMMLVDCIKTSSCLEDFFSSENLTTQILRRNQPLVNRAFPNSKFDSMHVVYVNV